MSQSSLERQPLLPNGKTEPLTLKERLKLFNENGPNFWQSCRNFGLSSWFNVFLVFVPLGAVAHFLQWDAIFRFAFNFLAIMPLAALLGTATDELSLPLGDDWAGLLNATFGNAVEIIVGVAALLHDELRIVQTSLLGSILSNILLVLGCSFFAGGLRYKELSFQATAAQTSGSLLILSVITLVIPAAYHAARFQIDPQNGSDDPVLKGLLTISRGTSIMLLIVYCVFLYFQMKSHTYLFDFNLPLPGEREGDRKKRVGNIRQERRLIARGDGPAIEGEAALEDGAADEDWEANDPVKGFIKEIDNAKMNVTTSAAGLLLVTIVTSFSADWLVASIEETADRYNISEAFIGIVLLPLVANAAEHVTSVWMALKNKPELTIAVSIGSSIQIALFIIPLLVIVGWITGHELTLFFAHFETVIIFLSVLLVTLVLSDGKSNYMEGLMLIVVYVVIGLAFFVS